MICVLARKSLKWAGSASGSLSLNENISLFQDIFFSINVNKTKHFVDQSSVKFLICFTFQLFIGA